MCSIEEINTVSLEIGGQNLNLELVQSKQLKESRNNRIKDIYTVKKAYTNYY